MNRALLLLLVCAACGPLTPVRDGGSDGSTPDGGAPSPVEIGTGSAAFIALHDGDNVDIITGPQGGHHIWGSIRAKAPLKPSGITVHYLVLLAGTREVLSDNPYKLDLSQNGPYYERYGMIGYLDDPSRVKDTPTVLRLEVTDVEGHTASDEHRVIPRGP